LNFPKNAKKIFTLKLCESLKIIVVVEFW